MDVLVKCENKTAWKSSGQKTDWKKKQKAVTYGLDRKIIKYRKRCRGVRGGGESVAPKTMAAIIRILSSVRLVLGW